MRSGLFNIGGRVLRSSFWRAISGLLLLSAFTGLLNFGSNLIAARALKPGLYSDYGAFLAILSVLLIPTTVFSTRAVQISSTRGVSIRWLHRLRQTSLRFGWVLAMAGGVVLIVVYHEIERSPITWWIAVGASALLLLAPIEAVFVGILQARKRFVASQLGRTLNGLFKVVGLGLLRLWGQDLYAAMSVVLLSLIASSGYIFYIGRSSRVMRRVPITTATLERWQRSRGGRWSLPLAITMGSVLFFNVDMLVAKWTFSAYTAGMFAALTVSGKILALGAGPINVVLYPHLLTSSDLPQQRRMIMGAVTGTLLIGVVVLTCFGFASRQITDTLFGPSYLRIAPLLVYYGIAFLFFSLANVAFTALLAFNARVLWADVIGGTFLEVGALLMSHQSLKLFTVALAVCMFLIWAISTVQLYPYLRSRR